MKKVYVMLIGRISGMGGGQMYVNNKLSFVSELGWDSKVFYAIPGEIVIPELRKHEENICEQMVVSPLVYSKKRANKIVDLLAEKIGDFDEAVIESGCPYMALWGEMIAKKLKCKHMVHLLDERLDKGVPTEYLNFYKFKHERKELSGINSSSLKILFRNDPMITDDNAYYLSSVCSNVLLETTEDPLNIPDEGVSIGCIGRLNKGYVGAVADSFRKLVTNHKEIKFNVVFIGGSDNPNDEKHISELFSDLDNANLIMAGTLYPIPSATIRKISLFASSAGSARVSYRENIPTISMDAKDLCPIGVLGYTTENVTYRKDEAIVDLADLAEQILFRDYLKDLPFTPSAQVSLEPLKKHIEFLENSDTKKEYFDVESLHAAGLDKKKRFICNILGPNLYSKLRLIRSKNIQ